MRYVSAIKRRTKRLMKWGLRPARRLAAYLVPAPQAPPVYVNVPAPVAAGDDSLVSLAVEDLTRETFRLQMQLDEIERLLRTVLHAKVSESREVATGRAA